MQFLRKPPSERRTKCQNRPSQRYLNFITLFFLSGDFLFGKLGRSWQQKRRTTYLTLLLTSLFLGVDGVSLKGNDRVGMGANPPHLAITTNSTFADFPSSKVEKVENSFIVASGQPQCLRPQNLVTDGSFDNGLASFPSTGGWQIDNNSPPAVINPGNEPSGTLANDYPAPGNTFAYNINDSANDAINVTPTMEIDRTYIDGQLDIWFDVTWQQASGGASHASTLVLNVNGTPYWQLVTVDGGASNMGTISTLNGAVTSSGSPTTLRGGDQFADSDWEVIRVSIPYTSNSTPQIQFVMQGQGLASDDFAIDRIYSPVCLTDRGDAPDSYGTDATAGNSGSDPVGPSHRIINDLHLGTSPDGEADAVLPLDGTGDGADEDGVTLPTLTQGDTSYTIPASNITVTHNAGASPATLHGWIDFDGSGTFEADEYTSQTVSSGITNGNPDGALSWSGPGVSGITGSSNIYARFRLTTDSSINQNTPGGLASDGEVEDYQIVIPLLFITGTIFEDVNYGGGAGRDLISSSGVNLPNVRVELYDSTGAFMANQTTDSNGLYQFSSGIIDGQTYSVRVVNNTVTSSRTLNAGHTTADTLAVQTYRYDPDETTPAITDEVGGVQPALIDSDSNTTSANLSTLTAQSVSTFTLSGTTNGVDFGFNFDTIVNTNDSGQGSLRQFISNSNALDNTGLAQDLPASITAPLDKDGNPVTLTDYETSIFMIPDPNNDSRVILGTGTGEINLSNSPPDGGTGSAFVINISSVLTQITDPFTAVDGRTQSVNIATVSNPRDTTVTGSETTGPELIIQLSNCTSDTGMLRVRASNFTLHSLGMTALDNICHGLLATAEASDVLEPSDSNALGNIIADSITAFSFGESGITFIRTDNSVIRNSVLRDSGANNSWDNIHLRYDSDNNVIEDNIILRSGHYGIDIVLAADSGSNGNDNNIIRNNQIIGNGTIGTGGESSGIGLRTATGSQITQNVIRENIGDGISIANVHITSINNLISQNSIVNNGELGIDLGPGNSGDGVTLNDAGDGDSGINGLQNFPAIVSFTFDGTNLTMEGTLNSTNNADFNIEIYSNAVCNPDIDGTAQTENYGEGEKYHTTVSVTTNNSGDATFSTTVPFADVAGKVITATATDASGNTSEFSQCFVIRPILLLIKRITAINGNTTTNNGDNLSIFNDDVTSLQQEEDNYLNWPDDDNIYLKGGLDGGNVGPGDEVEFTIYFLSVGPGDLQNISVCDVIPNNTTFVSKAFNGLTPQDAGGFANANRGIAIANDASNLPTAPTAYLSNLEDGDRGAFFAPGTTPPSVCKDPQDVSQPLTAANNTTGAVVVNIVKSSDTLPAAITPGTPINSYGFIRFRVNRVSQRDCSRFVP